MKPLDNKLPPSRSISLSLPASMHISAPSGFVLVTEVRRSLKNVRAEPFLHCKVVTLVLVFRGFDMRVRTSSQPTGVVSMDGVCCANGLDA